MRGGRAVAAAYEDEAIYRNFGGIDIDVPGQSNCNRNHEHCAGQRSLSIPT